MSFLVALFSTILSSIWSGYVLTFLWLWFIVPVFNAPTLSVVSAMGISLVVSYLTFKANFSDAETDDYNIKLAVFGWMKPTIVLAVGYIYTLFM